MHLVCTSPSFLLVSQLICFHLSFCLSICLPNSFIPFFLLGDHNEIWQDAEAVSDPLSTERQQKRWGWSTQRDKGGRTGIPAQTHTDRTHTCRASHFLSSHLSHPLCPVLTWLAGGEIDACVSSWKRTQRWNLIHCLHLLIWRKHTVMWHSESTLTFTTCVRNKDSHEAFTMSSQHILPNEKYLSIMNKK